jgi:uncharacterized membrane protein YoaK (UPF0700 family)
MVRAYADALDIYLLGLPIFLFALGVIIVVLIRIFFCLYFQTAQEAVLISKQQFCEMMIIECMDDLFVAFVFFVQLEWFCRGVLIQELRIVLDQPLGTTVTVEDNYVFLSQHQRTNKVFWTLLLDIIADDVFACFHRPYP